MKLSEQKKLKSKICDYNDAYIIARGDITINRCNQKTQIALKNCVAFSKCFTKNNGTTIHDAEDVMLMYNLLEYSLKYFDTTGSLGFYSKDETYSFNDDTVNSDDFKTQLLIEHMKFLEITRNVID